MRPRTPKEWLQPGHPGKRESEHPDGQPDHRSAEEAQGQVEHELWDEGSQPDGSGCDGVDDRRDPRALPSRSSALQYRIDPRWDRPVLDTRPVDRGSLTLEEEYAS